ncbi:MAG: DNA repair protein RecN, partial [Oscillospiraceae bacterium]|nr:DNA repair protein RecN [Oscillospiraceae bacterium]
TIEEILNFAETARAELEKIEFSGERLEKLQAQERKTYAQTKALADELTQTRLQAFDRFSSQIRDTLTFLNMPNIQLVLQHQTGNFTAYGQDVLEFYICTNLGETPKPLAKIASGGELARIMLAIKSALADKDEIATLIYDEIDTGVSGLAAGRIGEKLLQTAKGHQIICVTHTAQIAAYADNHLLIKKVIENGRTYTNITPLDEPQRVEELARIISGDKVTELSLANAKEMLFLSRG